MIVDEEALPWVIGGGALALFAFTVGATVVYKVVARRRERHRNSSGVNSSLLEHIQASKNAATPPKQIAYNTIMDSPTCSSTPVSAATTLINKPRNSTNHKMFLQLWLNKTASEGYPLEDVTVELNTPESVQYNADGTIKLVTYHKLVEILIRQESNEPLFKENFFATYTSFCLPNNLITSLISFSKMYSDANDNKHEKACFDLIEFWVNNNLKDLNLCKDKDKDLLFATLFKYVNKTESPKSKPVASTLSTYVKDSQAPVKYFMANNLLQKKEVNLVQEETVNDTEGSEREECPIYPESDSEYQTNNAFEVLEWNPKEIARQLTIIERSLLIDIPCYELCKLRYTEKNMNSSAPCIAKCIQFFNKFSLWSVNLILSFEDAEMRAATITFFIELLEQLVTFGNFNTCMSVLGAINNSAVTRLKATQELLSEESLDTLDAINELTSSANKFSNLKEAVDSTPGCVPFLGVYLSDLFQIESGNKNKMEGDVELINWNRCRGVANVCRQIQVCQVGANKYEDIPFLQTHLVNVDGVLNDDELYERSLIVEPRTGK